VGTYTIANGDTLGSLARKYQTSVSALAKANGIKNPNRIIAGKTLNIPNYNKAVTQAAPVATPQAPQAPVAPPTPSLEEWLAGDSTYNSQQAGYNRSKADYEAQYNQQQQNTNRDYAISQRALDQQGTTDRDQQLNDYAGRGIVNSGVYGTALSEYNQGFNTKVANLNQGLQDTLNNQNNAHTNYLRQLQLEQDTAKQDAIRRRAQSLGI
jgi:LysM repeat protein